jgi:hypothetical protein
MGEVDRSPMLPLIRKYMQTPQPYEHEVTPAVPARTETTETTIPRVGFEDVPPSALPGFQNTPPPPPPSSALPAALPAASPTEPGTPPMTPPPPPPAPSGVTGRRRPLAPGEPPMAVSHGPTAPAAPGARALPGPQPQQIDTETLAVTPPLYDTEKGISGGQVFKTGVEVAQPRPPAPPWPPESFPVSREIPGTAAQTETRYRLPEGFPTTEDTAAAATEGRDIGEWRAAVRMFRGAGAPDPEKAATEYITSQKAGGFSPGPVIPDPDSPTGYSQQWVDRRNPAIRQKIPAPAPGTTSNRAASVSEQVAHTLYGQPGEDAKTTFARIQREPDGPQKMQNVMKRTQYFIASKPMDVAQQFQARGKLQDDWMQISTRHRVMVPQIQIMRSAWTRAHEDPKNVPAASEQILITFQRMLDPDSVVRETEARRPGSMQPMLNRIQGWIDELRVGGPGIPLAGLEPYYEAAEDILRMTESVMAEERQRILATADQYGIGPLNLVGFQPAPPRPGLPGSTSKGPPAPPGGGGGGAGGAAGGGGGGAGGISLTTPLDQIDPVTGQRITR